MWTPQGEVGVPAPDRPWDEIVPGLWMGGHQILGRGGRPESVVVRDEFDLVQTLLRLPGHGPDPGVEHQVWPIPDGPLDGAQFAGVRRLAGRAGEALDGGRRVLVRCYHGYNRSGLVIAQVLMGRGVGAEEAIRLIRARRSPWALHNELFTRYLRADPHAGPGTGPDTGRDAGPPPGDPAEWPGTPPSGHHGPSYE